MHAVIRAIATHAFLAAVGCNVSSCAQHVRPEEPRDGSVDAQQRDVSRDAPLGGDAEVCAYDVVILDRDVGPCNDLINDGPVVTPTSTTGIVPTGRGGIFADGRYHLTSWVSYGMPPARVGRQTFTRYGRVQHSVHEYSGEMPNRTSGTSCVSGNMLVESATCGGRFTNEWTFDAEGTRLRVYYHGQPDTGAMLTYERVN